MKYELELMPPMMPNFISFKEDEVKSGHAISVSDLTEEQAIEYGELMKQSFISHWKLRKKL
jgi:hypothetical protein